MDNWGNILILVFVIGNDPIKFFDTNGFLTQKNCKMITYQTVFPDQTITTEYSGFDNLDVWEICAGELSIGDNQTLIDNIDFRPTGVNAFHLSDDGDAIKIVFKTKDGEKTFYFDEVDEFNFQDEADKAYFSRRNQ